MGSICKFGSRLDNCIIRGLGERLLKVNDDGCITVNLDGYAIIPRDEYEELLKIKEAQEKV